MKIGVDARLLSRQITGIGRYTLEMCQAMSKIQNTSLYIYSPVPIRSEIISNMKTAVVRTGHFSNLVFKQLWSESILPLWAKKDEVDVFWGPAHRLPLWLPKKVARVVTIHDLVWKYAPETMRPLSRFLENYQMPLAVRTADKIAACSKSTAAAVKKEFFIDANKISIIPLGSNLSAKSAPTASLKQLGIERQYFLFVGTLEPRKNLARLLQAYSRLTTELKNQAMMVIAGGKGWGNINIENAVEQLGLSNHVRLLGYVDDQTLVTLYSNAQFLAMPSLYEGFGLPLVEAMAHGTPALTSNNSSMPEVVGDAGLLIDPLDANSIQAGLTQLIADNDFRKKLSCRAQQNAARFNWDCSAKKLAGEFEKAIANRRAVL